MVKLFTKTHPIKQGTYAVMGGTYGGEYIVYINENQDFYNFYGLTSHSSMEVPKKSFTEGLEGGLLEFVKKLPSHVYNSVEYNYKNINNKNGLRNSEKNSQPDQRSCCRA